MARYVISWSACAATADSLPGMSSHRPAHTHTCERQCPCTPCSLALLAIHSRWTWLRSASLYQSFLAADTLLSLTMLVQYSVMLSYSVEGAETSRGLHDAIDGVKEVDPQGCVPRLLAGLLLADPTVAPSVVLGSKQEAMVSITGAV